MLIKKEVNKFDGSKIVKKLEVLATGEYKVSTWNDFTQMKDVRFNTQEEVEKFYNKEVI